MCVTVLADVWADAGFPSRARTSRISMPSTIRINEGARFIMRCTTRDRPSLLWPGNLDPRAGAGVMTTESLSEEVPRRSLLTTVEDLQPFASAPRPAPRAARCSLYPQVRAVRVLALSAGNRAPRPSVTARKARRARPPTNSVDRRGRRGLQGVYFHYPPFPCVRLRRLRSNAFHGLFA